MNVEEPTLSLEKSHQATPEIRMIWPFFKNFNAQCGVLGRLLLSNNHLQNKNTTTSRSVRFSRDLSQLAFDEHMLSSSEPVSAWSAVKNSSLMRFSWVGPLVRGINDFASYSRYNVCKLGQRLNTSFLTQFTILVFSCAWLVTPLPMNSPPCSGMHKSSNIAQVRSRCVSVNNLMCNLSLR